MTLRRVVWVVAVLACLAVTSCAGTGTGASPSGAGGEGVAATRVDVDTPALRTLKRRAGIEPCPATTDRAAVADGLPGLALACLGGGRPVTLSGLRGPLVVNLFAQWCGPCRGELPYYQQLHAEGRGTVRVLGVDYLDAAPDGALQLARATGVRYPLVADPGGRLKRPFYVRGLPVVVLVDRTGRVIATQYRVFRSYAELRSLVQQRLHVRLPA